MTAFQDDKRDPRAVSVDLGSSRLRWGAGISPNGADLEMLAMGSKSVRLGEAVFRDGSVPGQAVERIVETIGDWKEGPWTDLGAATFFPVATSALREASNAAEVRRAIHAETGLPFLIIDGNAEARFISKAILAEIGRDLPLAGKTILMADYGGGSTELSIAVDGSLREASIRSIPIGSMRSVLRRGIEMPGIRDAALADIRDQLDSALKEVLEHAPSGKVDLVVGSGGNIREYASLQQARVAGHTGRTLTAHELGTLINMLEEVPTERRSAAFSIGDARADVIVPAGRVFQMCLELVGAHSISVAQSGLRHGLLLSMIDSLRNADSDSDFQRAAQFAESCCRGLGNDVSAARERARFAISVFDTAQGLHGLSPRHRNLLSLAATVQQIGVNFSEKDDGHKTAFQMLLTLPFSGLSRDDRLLVACLVRHSRGPLPKASRHDHVDALPAEHRRAFTTLCPMMRLACDMSDATPKPTQEFRLRLAQGDLRVGLENGFPRGELATLLGRHETHFRTVFHVSLEAERKAS